MNKLNDYIEKSKILNDEKSPFSDIELRSILEKTENSLAYKSNTLLIRMFKMSLFTAGITAILYFALQISNPQLEHKNLLKPCSIEQRF